MLEIFSSKFNYFPYNNYFDYFDNYYIIISKKWGGWDLNPRPSGLQPDALPG